MKSVVLICLLCLSLSQPTIQAATSDVHPETAVQPKENAKTDLKPAVEQAKTQVINATDPTQNTPTETQNATATNKTQSGKNETVTNETSAKTTTIKPDEAKVENKTETEKKNETTPTTTKPEESPKDANNATKKEDTEKKPADATTQSDAKKNETVTTEKSKVATTEKPKDIQPVQARAFDGPSFFGGIILTLGLLAIGFMGYKYYKNQTDGNYHTL